MAKKQLKFSLHAKQQEAWKYLFKTDAREVALISGVQGGKTIFGALATLVMFDKHAKAGDNILVGAPTYKILEQATLPTFQKVFTNYHGSYNGQEKVFKTHKGVNIWFRTGTDPDSVEGIPDCVFAWMDEAGKCPRRFWANFQGRVARRGGKILYTTTWYALNWLFKEVWRPFEMGKRDDLKVVSFNSAENPTFPKEELERQRKLLNPAEFQRKFLGEPGKVHGMVHDGFGPQNFVDAMDFDWKEVPVYGAIDWGYDHPMGILLRAYPGDGNCYTVNIFKRSGLSTSQMLDVIEQKHRMFHVKHFACGHDRPDMIQELNKKGIRATKYFERHPAYRTINAGNQKHSEWVRSGVYKIFRGIDQIEDLEDEYLSYAWKEVDEGKEDPEKPLSVNDDLMACERYLTVSTMHLLQERKKKAKLTPSARLDLWDPGKPKQRNYDEY